DERRAPREPDAGEDERQRARQRDGEERLRAARAEVSPDVEVDRLDRKHPRDGVQQHEEEDAARDDRVLRALTGAEHEYEEREDRALRDRVQRADHRVQRRAQVAREAHREPEDQRRHRADEKADADPAETDDGIVPQLARREQPRELLRNCGGRREEAHVEEAEAAGALPQDEEEDWREDRDETLGPDAADRAEPAARGARGP